MGSSLTIGHARRHRAAVAAACLAVVVLATAVQVMHHCTALELNQQPGSAPVFCAICMTVQPATLAVAALLITISRLLRVEPITPSPIAPELAVCFALSVRPPPSL